MISEIEAFINTTKIKSVGLYAGVLKELLSEYPNETRRQHVIRGMIKIYEAQYKPEMRRHDNKMRQLRETRANEFASDEHDLLRSTFGLPDSLVTRINVLLKPPMFPLDEPTLLSEEANQKYGEDMWFNNNFKRYVIPHKF